MAAEKEGVAISVRDPGARLTRAAEALAAVQEFPTGRAAVIRTALADGLRFAAEGTAAEAEVLRLLPVKAKS